MNRNEEEKPLLSICISTYNRRDKLLNIVNEILKSNISFEIIISDDSTKADLQTDINKLNDSRISYYYNKVSQGANKNWYISLNHGRGKYLFQLLDRDWISHQKLNEFGKILENETPAFGYAGWSITGETNNHHSNERYTVYSKGRVAFQRFAGALCHPSGFFISSEIFRTLNAKRYFFLNRFGVYPHSFVFTKASLIGSGMIVRNDLCDYRRCRREPLTKSGYYSNKKRINYWWHPVQKFCQFRLSAGDIKRAPVPRELKIVTMIDRYNEQLEGATKGYYFTMQDSVTQNHYGLSTKKISKACIFMWGIWFYLRTLIFLRRDIWNTPPILLRLNKNTLNILREGI